MVISTIWLLGIGCHCPHRESKFNILRKRPCLLVCIQFILKSLVVFTHYLSRSKINLSLINEIVRLILQKSFDMHYENCKWIQCAPTDDVCYTGQMNYNGGYKNYVRGCADSSVLQSQCGNIGKVSCSGIQPKVRTLPAFL